MSDMQTIKELVNMLNTAGGYTLIAVAVFFAHKLIQLASFLVFAKFVVTAIMQRMKESQEHDLLYIAERRKLYDSEKEALAKNFHNPKYVPHRGDVGL